MQRPNLPASLALLAALALAACGSDPLPLGPGPDAGGSEAAGAFSPACLHFARYFTGGQCGAPALPPAEVARVTPRWAEHCEALLAMPGSTTTAAAIDQCLTLLEAGACASYNFPDVCASVGMLAGGAACNEYGKQCQSGTCTVAATAGPCGTCLPVLADGQPCDPAGLTNRCALGSTCASAFGDGGTTCAPLGQNGSRCLQEGDCASGLHCGATLTCAPPTGSGAACLSVFECGYPQVCNINADQSSTCQAAGPAGSPCLDDTYCASGLACSKSQTCGVLVWKTAGQPCDGDLARCVVGACPTGGASARPMCPAVLDDGAPCVPGDPAQVCDVLAKCLGGKCMRPITVTCQ